MNGIQKTRAGVNEHEAVAAAERETQPEGQRRFVQRTASSELRDSSSEKA